MHMRVANTLADIMSEQEIDAPSWDQLLKLVKYVAPRISKYSEVTERFLLKFALTATLLGEDFDLDDPRVSEQMLRNDLTRLQKEELLESYVCWRIKQAESNTRVN